MLSRLLALPLLGAAALLVSAAPAAARTTANAVGVLAAAPGSPDTYTLTVTATAANAMVGGNGAEAPLACIRFSVTSVQVLSVDQPGGTTTTLDSGQGFTATITPPLQTNASVTWAFTTSGAYAAGDGTLAYSVDCSTYVAGSLAGPTASAPPIAPPTTTVAPTTTTTAAQHCTCASVQVSINPSGVYTSPGELAPDADPAARLAAIAHWTMTCTAGVGGCTAAISVSAPAGETVKTFAVVPFVPRTGRYAGRTLYRRGAASVLRFSCRQNCTAPSRGEFFLLLEASGKRKRTSSPIRLQLFVTCTSGSTETLRFAFSRGGGLDAAASRLG